MDPATEGEEGFRLTLTYEGAVVETFERLTIGGDRDAVRMVNDSSRYIRVAFR